MSTTFRSLAVRNYRLFFVGQGVSVTGTWMQQIAQDWLVVHLGGKGGLVGLTVGLQFLPMLLFGLWGGVVADRFDKRRVLLATQTIAGSLAVTMGVLVATGTVRLWMVLVFAFLLGCVTSVEQPTRQAFVTEMVGPEEVANAVALNSAMFNAARIVGPAIAATIITLVGISPAFFANGASYVAVVLALGMMDGRSLRTRPVTTRAPGQIRAGLRYVWRDPALRSTTILVGVVSTFGFNLAVVLPLLAKFSFGGGAGTYGILTSSMAVGSLAGALLAARREHPSALLRAGGAVAYGSLAVATAAAPSVATAVPLLVLTGAAVTTFASTCNATLQLTSSDAMRGRVMALYGLVLLGSTPIGGPLTGWLAQRTNPRVALAAGASVALVAGLVALVRAVTDRRTSAAVVHAGVLHAEDVGLLR